MTLQAHMFEGLSEDQKQQVAVELSEMDAKLPGGGLTLRRGIVVMVMRRLKII